MKRLRNIIIVFLILSIVGISVIVYMKIIVEPKVDKLINNIQVRYNNKKSALSEQKMPDDLTHGENGPLAMNIKDTMAVYSQDDDLRKQFDKLLQGYESDDTQSKRIIKQIVLEGIKKMTEMTNEIIIDAIDLSQDDFQAWTLPRLPHYETIVLPSELTHENSNKSLSFITNDYYVRVPSEFFNKNENGNNVELDIGYKNNMFSIAFPNINNKNQTIEYTNWEHPITISIKRPNNKDTVVTRNDARIARSFAVDDNLYIYAYADGKYSISDMEIKGNKYISFIDNREILGNEILQKEFITRGDFIAALMRSGYTEISADGNNAFAADVSSTHEYIDEFNTGAGKEIVAGIAEGVLAPEQNLTVQEIYTLLGRFIDKFNIGIRGVYPNTTEIKNMNDFDDYAKVWTSKMKQMGFILPEHISPQGYMDPKASVKTKEAMEMIYKLIVEGGRDELKYAQYKHNF